MVFIITLSYPQKNALLFFFLKSLYLGIQLLLKISHLSKYLAKTNVNIEALLSSMCCYLNYSIKLMQFEFLFCLEL